MPTWVWVLVAVVWAVTLGVLYQRVSTPLDADRQSHEAATVSDQHWLTVSVNDGEREYEIEHPGCKTEEWPTGIDAAPAIVYYACAVGELWSAVGSDAVPDIETLTPGRYPVAVRSEHTPSLPTNGGEEWDAWIEVLDA